jgi:hypothetical protein
MFRFERSMVRNSMRFFSAGSSTDLFWTFEKLSGHSLDSSSLPENGKEMGSIILIPVV